MAIGHHKARALAAKPVTTFEDRLQAFRHTRGAAPVPKAKPVAASQPPPTKLCPCGCARPVAPGNEFAGKGCGFRHHQVGKTPTDAKKAPTPIARPAVARGIPAPVVAAFVDVMGVAEDAITLDATLAFDLGADAQDVTELSMRLEADFGLRDDLGETWEERNVTVGDVVKDLRKAGAKL
jgi:acyl carrier protein